MAALDLGSNSFLCLVAEVKKTSSGKLSITEVYSDELETVRLGEGVDKTKKLSDEALSRAQKCLQVFKKTIETHQPEKVLAMATSAARDSSNSEKLFELGKALNIPIEIIAGESEAQITYQGSISGQLENKKRLIIDIGGGSTEFIVGDFDKILASKSLNMGCVRGTEKFFTKQPTPANEVMTAQKSIQEQMALISDMVNINPEEILAVAGTPTSLVVAELGFYDANKIDGFHLTRDQLEVWKIKLQKATLEEKLKMGLPKGRADVMLIGVLILIETLSFFKKQQMLVSTRGVRHGIALEIARRSGL